ncbi:hypothetical protein ACOMHN_006923 [Nucella lapillus]
MVLVTGKKYNLTCTASVGTLAGEEALWPGKRSVHGDDDDDNDDSNDDDDDDSNDDDDDDFPNGTRIILVTGKKYNLTCTASVGTLAGEEALWIWEFQSSGPNSPWRKVNSTGHTASFHVTTITTHTVTDYQQCLTQVQNSTLTLKPRREDPSGRYRCYVFKGGVSFGRELAGIFLVRITIPLSTGLFGSMYRLWYIVLAATFSIFFLVVIFIVVLMRMVRRTKKTVSGRARLPVHYRQSVSGNRTRKQAGVAWRSARGEMGWLVLIGVLLELFQHTTTKVTT